MKRTPTLTICCAMVALLVGACGMLDDLQKGQYCCCQNSTTSSTAWMRSVHCVSGGDPSDIRTCVADNLCKGGKPISDALPFVLPRWQVSSAVSQPLLITMIKVPAAASRRVGVGLAECVKECANAGPFCLQVAFTRENRLDEQLSKTSSLFRDSSRRVVPKADLMRMFGIRRDECGRGDTIFKDGRVTNTGMACTIAGEVGGSTPLSVRLVLSPRLEGTRTFRDDGVEFEFTIPAASPELAFGDERFNKSFGGRVEAVRVQRDRAVISTVAGCIGIGLLTK
jgi:hypothetical protein